MSMVASLLFSSRASRFFPASCNSPVSPCDHLSPAAPADLPKIHSSQSPHRKTFAGVNRAGAGRQPVTYLLRRPLTAGIAKKNQRTQRKKENTEDAKTVAPGFLRVLRALPFAISAVKGFWRDNKNRPPPSFFFKPRKRRPTSLQQQHTSVTAVRIVTVHACCSHHRHVLLSRPRISRDRQSKSVPSASPGSATSCRLAFSPHDRPCTKSPSPNAPTSR